MSAPFQLFLAKLGIRHASMAPFPMATNGLAEQVIRSAKEILGSLGPLNRHHNISQYLLAQHSTPCPTIKQSPAKLLIEGRLRTTLDRLHPNYAPRPLMETLHQG